MLNHVPVPTLEEFIDGLFYKLYFLIPSNADWVKKIVGIRFPDNPVFAQKVVEQLNGIIITFLVEKASGVVLYAGMNMPVQDEKLDIPGKPSLGPNGENLN